MDKQTMAKAFVSAALGGAVVYFHAILIPIVMLLAVMMIDYLTGMARAWTKAELSSEVGLRGIIKKLGYLMAVCVAAVVDWLITSGLKQVGIIIEVSYYVGIMVTIWFIINELISILENLDAIGVPLPTFLTKILKHIKKQIDDKGGKDDE